MHTSVLAIISVVALAGCTFGQRPRDLPFTRGPLGADATVNAHAGAVRGELVAVEDSGLLVLRTQRLVFIPLERIRTVTIQTLGEIRLQRGSPENFRNARLVSRHPYGLSPAIVAALLRTYGQTEPDRL
jgi:hypothetical protein